MEHFGSWPKITALSLERSQGGTVFLSHVTTSSALCHVAQLVLSAAPGGRPAAQAPFPLSYQPLPFPQTPSLCPDSSPIPFPSWRGLSSMSNMG